MVSHSDKKNDVLLADLEESINRALEKRMPDLAGALYRLQGSAKGWCDLEDCGGCPLAPLMCINGMEERVSKLIEAYHASKEQTLNSFTYANSYTHSTLNPQMTLRKKASAIPVGAYFDRLQDILAEKTSHHDSFKLDNSQSGHKLRWQRVNDAFLHPFPNIASNRNR
tara:strand:- start:262 stop:765 length:504 start_codon:yes stop_codon:yes gene_type:complete